MTAAGEEEVVEMGGRKGGGIERGWKGGRRKVCFLFGRRDESIEGLPASLPARLAGGTGPTQRWRRGRCRPVAPTAPAGELPPFSGLSPTASATAGKPTGATESRAVGQPSSGRPRLPSCTPLQRHWHCSPARPRFQWSFRLGSRLQWASRRRGAAFHPPQKHPSHHRPPTSGLEASPEAVSDASQRQADGCMLSITNYLFYSCWSVIHTL